MSEYVLYSYYRSSASFRVRIALNLKGLKFEYRPVHLLRDGGEQLSSEYARLNPSREVPLLVHNGRGLAQSMAIIDYLDSVEPKPRLLPNDSYLRAQVIQACEVVNSGTQPLQNLKVLKHLETQFQASQQQKESWAQHWIHQGLKSHEALVSKSKGPFAMGEQVSAADLFLVPQVVTSRRFKADLPQFSRIMKVFEHCMTLEAFQKASPENQPDFEA